MGAAAARCMYCAGAPISGSAARRSDPPRPIATPSNPAHGVAARPLSAVQQRALRRESASIAYPLFLLLMLLPCAAAAYLFVPLRPLNPGPHVLLTLAPLAAWLLSVAIGWLWKSIAHASFERLCTAIAPKAAGARPRCYTCGEHLQARGYLQRCPACGSDNVTDPGAMRRAGKSDLDLNAEARRPVLDEIALRHHALERATGLSRGASFVLPVLALGALGVTLWHEQWHLPALSPRRHAVIAAPGCNMVVTAIGDFKRGFVRTDVALRGSWVVHDELPLVYDYPFNADEFLHRIVLFPADNERGEVTSVFRTPDSPKVRLTVDVNGSEREMPLIRSCIEEGDPYRDVDGLTRAQRDKTRAEHQRLVLQGQVHDLPAGSEPGKLATTAAGSKAASKHEAAPAINPAVDPSLQVWTKPQR